MNPARYASQTYAKTAIEVADPRQLEAGLLQRAAAQLQAVRDNWCKKPPGLSEALLYNRRLWLIFIDAVSADSNRLPIPVRQNILNIAIFVMAEIFSLMTKPDPSHLDNLIHINKRLAAGLDVKPASKIQRPDRTDELPIPDRPGAHCQGYPSGGPAAHLRKL
jgi:flagellar protein FlaF